MTQNAPFDEKQLVELKMRLSRCQELTFRMVELLKETDDRLTDLAELLRPFCETVVDSTQQNADQYTESPEIATIKKSAKKKKVCILQ